MHTIQFPASMLRGALCCAAKGDVRYYINGVYLDTRAGRMVSTNGHILFIGQTPTSTEIAPIIVPRDTIELALKGLGKKGVERTDIIVRCNEGVYDLYTTAGTFGFTPIDGRFPEYERIVPQFPSGKLAQFDPRLLVKTHEALSWVAGRPACPALIHNGDNAAIHTQSGLNAFCLVMPWRADSGDSREWYHGAKVEAA